ncbi:MAG: hypothetical protein K2Q17_18675 [Nitrospiraceae bacterium]|jgi:hypothetical protein|uniref:hypothetical protein n=1 Tax=Nitrospira cf. moscoviensis SBR1015 TaxID=96242 RepID=UPI000A09FCCD|nr:hypothetical protein [Nitrospira cf. moscoviensis SBR1015]MBY0249683.1 hypothetical protein [Nitrospiraceae bacterium]OQW33873.1 MAG: hypothetical protein A4E20_12525 [Nitrospira sp. SG-bin2]
MTASEYRAYLAPQIPRLILVCAVAAWTAWIGSIAIAESRETPAPRYPITIDATSIVSQSWWQVPGITPSIWTSDPETSDAYRTTEPRVLQLQPGQYKFISFTFDFPFEVTTEGTVAYASSLNQCVEGRGTPTLIVRCKRTYPHGGQPEYSQNP